MMCDTLYRKTESGFIFGKNTDRSPNEPSLIQFFPRKAHNVSEVTCTYISIPQVKQTYATLLVKPSWMWGAEMGINEFGVVIGNEAVFTKSITKRIPALLGMDLLRLGLERSKTAHDAMSIIIDLLERFGQGGNCGYDKYFYYDNSFLIADNHECFILETSGKRWVVKKVRKQGNISNRLSINQNYFFASGHLTRNFAKRHTERIFTYFSKAKQRELQGCEGLRKDGFTVHDMMNLLQSHHSDDHQLYEKGSIRSICMHYSKLGDHTTNSMIVEVRNIVQTIWVTGTSTPCLSVFKPVYFCAPDKPVFDDSTDSFNYWLENEYIRRAIYANYIDVEGYIQQQQALQNRFFEQAELAYKKTYVSSELALLTKNCFDQEAKWLEIFKEVSSKVQENNADLPKLWQKKTKVLGKNPFSKLVKDHT